nr:immunoglobulin light chain junction region [Macaca mulatta]
DYYWQSADGNYDPLF